MPLTLEKLDDLNDELRQALVAENWSGFSDLNSLIQPAVEGVMTSLRAGEVSPEAVQERLETLQSLCLEAQGGAERTREEARAALKDIQRNQQATRAYHNVQGGPAG
ncbi:SOS cell division inhibitor [Marinobacter sp. SS21]|uniref:SOS cell division inhibitor n=1 Tax=Marinobacter sp. SS21 TaxID=2979460 RepID=UPI00232C4322|nr:SOS cell division inhibitor [Marinobacter sp. SS21]MDC0662178.1 SOS cell division inhibitor [Marinobacter sp. SS21]